MTIIFALLLAAAFACFLLAAASARPNSTSSASTQLLIALGLALWVAVPMIQMFSRLD